MNETFRNLAPLFERMEEMLHDFKRETYSDIFQRYLKEHKDFFDELNRNLAAGEAEGFIDAFAQQVVDYVANTLEAMVGKGKREKAQLNYNMFMAVYLMPAILEGKQKGAQALTDGICEKWAGAFKGNHIKSADYATIASGFRTKLCYITTAVCKSQHKPDDCYELELLRDYRDRYLMKTPEGAQIVEKYYDVAPTIVKRINKSADAEEKYQYIWEHYLKQCIVAIENGDLEVCGKTYMDMVEELCGQYMTTAGK